MRSDLEKMIDGIVATQMTHRIVITHLVADVMREQNIDPQQWAEKFITDARMVLENHRDGIEHAKAPFGWADDALKALDGMAQDIRLIASIQAEKRASA